MNDQNKLQAFDWDKSQDILALHDIKAVSKQLRQFIGSNFFV